MVNKLTPMSAAEYTLTIVLQLSAKLERMESANNKIMRTTFKMFNRDCGDGSEMPFIEVPFSDGSTPSEHNLPLLTNAKSIKNLNLSHLREYYAEYTGHCATTDELAMKKAIVLEIGVFPSKLRLE
ncbi:hypothetical protein BDQ17DRAFT_1358541 [Cyathus striatus]|nr:hypothetical protein BDQ17DRAFT_1358541 [Cyathus striatus]